VSRPCFETRVILPLVSILQQPQRRLRKLPLDFKGFKNFILVTYLSTSLLPNLELLAVSLLQATFQARARASLISRFFLTLLPLQPPTLFTSKPSYLSFPSSNLFYQLCSLNWLISFTLSPSLLLSSARSI